MIEQLSSYITIGRMVYRGVYRGRAGVALHPLGVLGGGTAPPEVSPPPGHHREGAVTSSVHRGSRSGVAPLGISGGGAPPPLEFCPLLGIPGGASPTAELVWGEQSP